MKRTQEIAQAAFPSSAAHIISRENRVALGKALRDKISLVQHGRWKEAKDRPNPIDILRKSDARRMKELVPIRYGRMLQSPFSFYRGAAGVMASDLAQMPNTNLKVQACGDCHLMNFGGFATPERNIIFDINDFDETLPAPWEWDVKRLAASVALAARSMGLSDGNARDCTVASARSYREHMREYSRMDPLGVWYTNITVVYVRQLHDAKIKPMIETFNAEMLEVYAKTCGWALARAHAKIGEISATISGYLGSSSDEFDEAMGKFALAYADQVERDYTALKAAARKGKVPTFLES
jgi:hypothetical protein